MRAASTHVVQLEGVSSGVVRYDLLGRLVENTGLIRKTVVEILKRVVPQTFEKFYINPEEFIRKASAIINDAKAKVVTENIVYEKTNRAFDFGIFTTLRFAELWVLMP